MPCANTYTHKEFGATLNPVAEAKKMRPHSGMDDWGSKVRKLRLERGLNQAEFAKAVGVSQATVSRWESSDQQPDRRGLRKLISFLGKAAEILFVSDSTSEDRLGTLRVVAHVEAGTARESWEWPEEEQYDVPMMPDDRYPGVPRYAVKVRGNSMNELFPPGSYLAYVRVHDVAWDMTPGRRVLVQHRTPDGMYEYTCKELRRADDGSWWLSPRSTDPRHQAPVQFDPEDPDGTIIFGVVTGSYRPE